MYIHPYVFICIYILSRMHIRIYTYIYISAFASGITVIADFWRLLLIAYTPVVQMYIHICIFIYIYVHVYINTYM